MDYTNYFKTNQLNWDDRAEIHFQDKAGGYGVKAFLAGSDHLRPIERLEIGNVRGLRIAHLQCHFGIDTLCLARRGASCVGLDFSHVAITHARELQLQTGLDAQFIEANVYDAREKMSGLFDLVYVTWGTIIWLPDIVRWAKVVASLLKPGGALYLLECHPSLFMLDERSVDLRPRYDWRTPEFVPITGSDLVTYTGDKDPLQHTTTYEWIHPLSSVINAVIGAGMPVEWLHEHEEISWKFAPVFTQKPGSPDMWVLPEGFPRMPLSYSLRAVKA